LKLPEEEPSLTEIKDEIRDIKAIIKDLPTLKDLKDLKESSKI
ncbi:17261_t:CDS:1, partial [Dentiscutata heterogama]